MILQHALNSTLLLTTRELRLLPTPHTHTQEGLTSPGDRKWLQHLRSGKLPSTLLAEALEAEASDHEAGMNNGGLSLIFIQQWNFSKVLTSRKHSYVRKLTFLKQPQTMITAGLKAKEKQQYPYHPPRKWLRESPFGKQYFKI